ncbi:MAG: hypothetical protein GDA35_08090 [Hyphomonadaceae bacterium]|nr:hypothetical protein [Hyphomonadaceae bacterium]
MTRIEKPVKEATNGSEVFIIDENENYHRIVPGWHHIARYPFLNHLKGK